MISLNPFDPIIYQGLAQIYQSRKEMKKAEEMKNLLPLLQ